VLKTRLVVTVAALTALGLGAFGAATYAFYSRSELQRLDSQIEASETAAKFALAQQASSSSISLPTSGRDNDGDRGGRPENPDVVLSPGTYAAYVDSNGKLVTEVQFAESDSKPKLPELENSTDARWLEVGSSASSKKWRMHIAPDERQQGLNLVVAVPLTGVESALDKLVAIEAVTAAIVLVVLAGGSWWLIARQLRPLESMATATRSIGSANLEARVDPGTDPKSEVGQLGSALNSMLNELDAAFRERDATEARLRQFLADASHELRTPLTSIQGFSELYRLGMANDPEQLAVIMGRIESESIRMKGLVEDLLLLARMDQTRPFEPAPVDLVVLAADSCTDIAAAHPDRAIRLDAPEPVVVNGDAAHLQQALANLLANAGRHTPAGTPLEVHVTSDDTWAEISVRDHGPGLSEEALAHVFDRFWQADSARVGEGSGLGLSIVAAIAAEHGGSAHAANAADPAGGALFTLRIPITQASQDASAAD
jgi:two-component system OmpR family sensor kinase